ncbi:MAG: hypothetical protein M1835_003267 [Candelina submexicana]|nr:MAG: hypothetical protein M1835_003267 [Candelina submexicana]
MGASHSSEAGEDPRLDPSKPQYVPQQLRLPWIVPILECSISSTSDQKDYERDYLRIFRMMRNIFRFCDQRMLILDTVPNHEGSNLTQVVEGTEDVRVFHYAFVWFKRWLTFLHKSRIGIGERAELVWLKSRAEQLMDFEKGTYPADPIIGYHSMTDDSRWFLDLFSRFAEALNRLRNGGNEDLNANSQLMKELMLKEDCFEEELSRTHVEDCLLYKRVTVEQLNPTGPGSIEDIHTINKLERDSFFFRQLRQHGFQRPWKRLYLVKDDQTTAQATAIEQINAALNEGRPSRVLDIRPIAMSVVVDDTCNLCFSDYKDGELIIEQHCGHKLHQECIFMWFDNDSRYSFPCPSCRNDPGKLSYKIYKVNEDGERISIIPNENDPGFETEEVRNEGAYTRWLMLLEYVPMFLEHQDELRVRVGAPEELRVRALRHRELIIKRYKEEDEAYERLVATGKLKAMILPNGMSRMPPDPRLRTPDPGVRLMVPIEDDEKPHYFLDAHLKVEAYRWLRRHPEAAFHALVARGKPLGMPSSYWSIWQNEELWNAPAEESIIKTWLREPGNHPIARQLLRNPGQNPGMSNEMYKKYKDMVNRHLEDEREENKEVRAWLRARPWLTKSRYPLESRPMGPPDSDEMPEHLWLALERLAACKRELECEAIQWYAERDMRLHPNWRDQRGRIVVENMPPRLLRAWRNVAGDFPHMYSRTVHNLAPMGDQDPLVQAETPTRDEIAGLRNLDSIPLTQWYEKNPNTVPGNLAPALFIAYKLMRDESFGAESDVDLPELTPHQIAQAEAREEHELLNWSLHHPDLKSWMAEHTDNIPEDLEPALVRAFQRTRDNRRILKVLLLRTWMRSHIRTIHQFTTQRSHAEQPRVSSGYSSVPTEYASVIERLRNMRATEQLLPGDRAFVNEWKVWQSLATGPDVELEENINMPPRGLSPPDQGIYLQLLEPLDEQNQAIIRRHYKNEAFRWLNGSGELGFALRNFRRKPKDMPNHLYEAFYWYMSHTEESRSPALGESSPSSESYNLEEVQLLDVESDTDLREPGYLDPYGGLPEGEFITFVLGRVAQSGGSNRANILLPPPGSDLPTRAYQHICLANIIDMVFQMAYANRLVWEDLTINNRLPRRLDHSITPIMPILSRIFAPYQDHDDADLAGFHPQVLKWWDREEEEGSWIAADNNLLDRLPNPVPPEGILRRIWLGARRTFYTQTAERYHEGRARDLVQARSDTAEIERLYLAFPDIRPTQLDASTWRAYKRYRDRLPRNEVPAPVVGDSDIAMGEPPAGNITIPQQFAHDGPAEGNLSLESAGNGEEASASPTFASIELVLQQLQPSSSPRSMDFSTQILRDMDVGYNSEEETIDISGLTSEEGWQRFQEDYYRRLDALQNPPYEIDLSSNRTRAAEGSDSHENVENGGGSDWSTDTSDSTEDEENRAYIQTISPEQWQEVYLIQLRARRQSERRRHLRRLALDEDEWETDEEEDGIHLRNAMVKWARKANRKANKGEKRVVTGSRRSSGRIEKKLYNAPTSYSKPTTSPTKSRIKNPNMSATKPTNPSSPRNPTNTDATTPTPSAPPPISTSSSSSSRPKPHPYARYPLRRPLPTINDVYDQLDPTNTNKRRLTDQDYAYLRRQRRRRFIERMNAGEFRVKRKSPSSSGQGKGEEAKSAKADLEISEQEAKEIDKEIEEEESAAIKKRWEVLEREKRRRERRARRVTKPSGDDKATEAKV